MTEQTDRGADTVEAKNKAALANLDTRRKQFKPAKPKRDPNRRIQVAAKLLLDYGAQGVTDAVRSLNEDLESIGYPSGGSTSASPAFTDPAGEDAMHASNLIDQRETLRDVVGDICDGVDDLLRFTAFLTKVKPPSAEGVRLCGDEQHGRPGADEWGDESCTELPVRDSLCGRHDKANTRWRSKNGMKPNTAAASQLDESA